MESHGALEVLPQASTVPSLSASPQALTRQFSQPLELQRRLQGAQACAASAHEEAARMSWKLQAKTQQCAFLEDEAQCLRDELLIARDRIATLEAEIRDLRHNLAEEVELRLEAASGHVAATSTVETLQREVSEQNRQIQGLEEECKLHRSHLQISQEEHCKAMEEWKLKDQQLLGAYADNQACNYRIEGLLVDRDALQDKVLQMTSERDRWRQSAEEKSRRLAESQQLLDQRESDLREQADLHSSALSTASLHAQRLQAELQSGHLAVVQERDVAKSELREAKAELIEVRDRSASELAKMHAQNAQEIGELRQKQVLEFAELRRQHDSNIEALRAAHAQKEEVEQRWDKHQRQHQQQHSRRRSSGETYRWSQALAAEKDRTKAAHALVKQLSDALKRSEEELQRLKQSKMPALAASELSSGRATAAAADRKTLEELWLLLQCRDEELRQHRLDLHERDTEILDLTKQLSRARQQSQREMISRVEVHNDSRMAALDDSVLAQAEPWEQHTVCCYVGSLRSELAMAIAAKEAAELLCQSEAASAVRLKLAETKAAAEFEAEVDELRSELARANEAKAAAELDREMEAASAARQKSAAQPKAAAKSGSQEVRGLAALDRELHEKKLKVLIESELEVLHNYSRELDSYVQLRREAEKPQAQADDDTLAFEDVVAERLHALAGTAEKRILSSLCELQHPAS